jgi:hypothetical protein
LDPHVGLEFKGEPIYEEIFVGHDGVWLALASSVSNRNSVGRRTSAFFIVAKGAWSRQAWTYFL